MHVISIRMYNISLLRDQDQVIHALKCRMLSAGTEQITTLTWATITKSDEEVQCFLAQKTTEESIQTQLLQKQLL